MTEFKVLQSINERYSSLAKTPCCLSCGGALELAKPQKGEVCADLGSGRGADVLRMAELVGEDGFAYGVDTSDGMLLVARNTAEKLGVENVSFVKSSFEQIEIDDEQIDVLISNCSINHAENKDAVWGQVKRLLKNGGRFVVSDIYALEEVPAQYREDPQAVAECWAGAVTREVYLHTLEKLGFADIQILEESDPYEKGKIVVASISIQGKKPIPTTLG